MRQGNWGFVGDDAPNGDNASELRRMMVHSQIIARGIREPAVLRAMNTIPRERFVGAGMVNQAYDDRALGIDCGQTISQPYIVAFMSEALGVESNQRILEVGTGTGYQTAVLSMLADHVFTIERHADLSQTAQLRLQSLGIQNVTFHVGDGSLGWPEHSPYDRILVTASAPNITPPLAAQLAEDGRLVMPVGQGDSQILTFVEKKSGRLIERPSIPVRFVKLIGEAGFPE